MKYRQLPRRGLKSENPKAMGERRESKKRETRQRISDVATRLFHERGFDAVTLDEIAVAAEVSRMTIFNYFARKEDLVLDRQDDLELRFFREAIGARLPGQSPIDALRGVVGELRDKKHPFTRFDSQTTQFWRFVAANPPLVARLRDFDEQATQGLAEALGGPNPDGIARLAAGLIVLTVRTAREEAVGTFERSGSPKRAYAAFAGLVDQGFAAADRLLGEGGAA